MSDASLRLDLDPLGDALGRAATVLRASAMASGLEAPVPTCPDWTVLDLLVHLGTVHRWAASHLRSTPLDRAARQSVREEIRSAADPLDLVDAGATALLQAIVDAPDDLEALVFLEDPGTAKHFWTRRQAHETTIHAVDALAARLGRAPHPEETWIPEAVALDGIDELLMGFLPRRRSTVHPPEPTTVLVGTDTVTGPVAWVVATGPDHAPVVRREDGADPAAYDHGILGSPVALYLTLWNRTGAPDPWWSSHVTITES